MPASERETITVPEITAPSQASQSEYRPEFVARVREAAAKPLPERMSGDELMEHMRRLAQGHGQTE